MSETHVLETFQPEEQALLRQAVEVICSVAQQHGVEVVQIYLFGSRARGEGEVESDWDLYLIVDRELDFPLRQKLASRIRRLLVKRGMVCDLFLQGQETVRRRDGNTGYLTYYALRDGVRIYERRDSQKLDAQGR
ncbi:MAG: nucleotidyltransferase domain-containing protein [bacterium]|nr:nucleotidyltransferase domain-containing protein [bacterium]